MKNHILLIITLVLSFTLLGIPQNKPEIKSNNTHLSKQLILKQTGTSSNGNTNNSNQDVKSNLNSHSLLFNYYPQSAPYWTGSTEGTVKIDGEINTFYPNVGWSVFDISSISYGHVYSLTFHGYVNATYWPYWSITSMPDNPVTSDASTIYDDALSGYAEDTAYVFSTEDSLFTTGWHSYQMSFGAIADLQAAVNSYQGWFAIGFVEWDFYTPYFINFDGWSQPNPPYLEIEICLECPPFPPSNLTAICQLPHKVDLTWQDNSDDEDGFSVFRKLGDTSSTNQWVNIHNVSANTTFYRDTTVIDTTIYTYKVASFNQWLSTFSNYATVMTVIPVELINFNANLDNGKINLYWQTVTEKNNKGFEVEKQSGDMQLAAGDRWESIGFVEGYGTTTEKHSYSFIDSKIICGKYRYRLKQIDFNGSFNYSPVIEIDAGFPKEFSLSQNYPNPFNPTTTLIYAVSKSSFVTLKVYDVLGTEISTLVNEQKQPGEYKVNFNGSNLPSGIYIYKINAGNFTSVKKMLLLK